MSKKIAWQSLNHEQHLQLLTGKTITQILAEYELPGINVDAFRAYLTNRLTLWTPANLASGKRTSDAGPTKDPIMAASRDLDRSEALLELIDNSIDAWMTRRKKYPPKTAKELIIRMVFDPEKHQLTFEDNSGGLPEQKLPHLVIPGLSDTTELLPTIGSYKTGGKKAVFRLSTEANILTRYWNPSETEDEAWSVHLDEQWMNDATAFNFSYWPLEDVTALNRGQTRYVFQLREEPVGGTPWFLEQDNIKTITDEIRRTYSLLLIRNPNILIYFMDLDNPIKPIRDLYDFSGTNRDGTDIRPQQVTFSFKLPDPKGVLQPVEAEVILGARRTSGTGEGKSNWGIDLYGNDRLFVSFDQDTFSDLLPIRGNAKNLIRGLINLRGPNTYIPWDTHKRHLNQDREIMRVLTKHPTIRDFFDRWHRVYQALSKSDEVKRLISDPLTETSDPEQHDLYIPFRQTVTIDPARKKNAPLPKSVPEPQVNLSKKVVDSVQIKFSLSLEEARTVCSYFEIPGRVDSDAVAEQLADEIKAATLQTARRKKGGTVMAAPKATQRLAYGPNKYAAFHLLLARMFRHHASPDMVYQYVTLGGTELRDARSIEFIDRRLVERVVSFEEDDDRYILAQATAERLGEGGFTIEVRHESLFRGFTRVNTDRRHLFFVDFEGRCAFSDYDRLFGRMFRKEYICENDILLITSFIGGRQRRERVEDEYDPEFRILNVRSSRDKHATFRACHPSFTLYRALRDADLQDDLAVECFGFVAYRDRSPMGVYGYSILPGRTDLRAFLNAPRFETYGKAGV